MTDRMAERLQAHTRVGTRFVGLNDEPITLDEWAELFEDHTRRWVRIEPLGDGTNLVLIWCGEVLPEVGMLPWAITIHRAETGGFMSQLGQYPDRKTAEWRYEQKVRLIREKQGSS